MPRALLAIIVIVLLVGCKPVESERPAAPEIGRNLPSNLEEGQLVFDRRVKATFPTGTSEDRVVTELRRQKFQVDPSTHESVRFATFTRNEPIFQTIWSVRWRAENGRIKEIWGVYGVTGP